MSEYESTPLALRRHGRTTRLKWHRARRRSDDPPFTATRIVEGLAAGASVEVDLLIHADRGFAVLHDRDLRRETTGSGQVGERTAAMLRGLSLIDRDGRPTHHSVLLLEDLAALFADTEIAPNALLQLDFKQRAKDLDAAAITRFADAVAPFADRAILSCGDAAAVATLTSAAPGIRIGYDPCHRGAAQLTQRSRDYRGFVERALRKAPQAEMIYLDAGLVLSAAKRGFDFAEAFHQHGKAVDAYTLGGAANPGMVPVIDQLLDLAVDQMTVDDPEGIALLYPPVPARERPAHAGPA